MTSVKIASNGTRYGQDVAIRQFHLTADEPPSLGGDDAGPAPFEWVLAGLGSCKTITLKMYAERRGWPLEDVAVTMTYDTHEGKPVIDADLTLIGNLNEAQRQRLLEISDRCPVHRFLAPAAQIRTRLAQPA